MTTQPDVKAAGAPPSVADNDDNNKTAAPPSTTRVVETRAANTTTQVASMRAACRAAFCSGSSSSHPATSSSAALPNNNKPKGGVSVDAAACRQLGAALAGDAQARRAVRRAPALAKDSPLALPVRFATLEDEANLLALYHLLDFGTGYDAELRASGARRPQREALAFGVLGLHLGARPLDAEWMSQFGPMDAHSAFGIDATVDVPLKADLPGVTVSRPGPLAPLARAMRRALNETGALLLERQKQGGGDAKEQAKSRSLGALVLALLAEGNGIMGGGDGVGSAVGGGKAVGGEEEEQEQQQHEARRPKSKKMTSADFARELVDAVPAFDDWGLLLFEGAGEADETAAERLPFWRRAQNLAADLAWLAEDRERGGGGGAAAGPPPLPAELAFADGAARELSAEASPAVAAALRARGLLRYSPALAAAVDAGADLGGGGGGAGGGGGGASALLQASERAIRAATVAAVDAIVEGGIGGGGASTAPFTAREVSAWLSGQVAAAEEAREREREQQQQGGGRKRGGGGGEEGEEEEEAEKPQQQQQGAGGAVDAALLLKKHVYRDTTAY